MRDLVSGFEGRYHRNKFVGLAQRRQQQFCKLPFQREGSSPSPGSITFDPDDCIKCESRWSTSQNISGNGWETRPSASSNRDRVAEPRVFVQIMDNKCGDTGPVRKDHLGVTGRERPTIYGLGSRR